MFNLWLPRLFAGALALAAIRTGTLAQYVSIIFILSVSHTLLAAYYSRHRAKQIMVGGGPAAYSLVVLLLVSAVAIVLDAWPMYYLVLAHHVLNEVYTVLPSSVTGPARRRSFTVLFLLFETAVFASCSPRELSYFLGPVSPVALATALLFGFGGLLFVMMRGPADKSRAPQGVFLSLGLGAALYSLFLSPLNLDFLILYHFLFWLIFPALKTYQLSGKWDANYARRTLALAVVAFPFSLLAPNSWSLSVEQMSYLTRAFAYFHVFSTLAVSSSNPAFVTKFFGKRFLARESYENTKVQSAV